MWQRRGLAVDRTIPRFFAHPAPPLSEMQSLVPQSVRCPGGQKHVLLSEDKTVVQDSVEFFSNYIAEVLPRQMLCIGKQKPQEATHLAVATDDGSGGVEYVGSFDSILRVWRTGAGPWQPYHKKEVAVDFKVTGYHAVLGLNGPTMRTYVEHGRSVLLAAKSGKLRLGDCAAICYLVRRPAGLSSTGSRWYVCMCV